MSDPIQTTRPLVPQWTEEDFENDVVYQWLWDHHEEKKYLFNKYIECARRRAKELKITGFTKAWQLYVEMMSPRNVTVMGHNTTQFSEQPVELECGMYECTSLGVRYTGRMGEEIDVLSHPLLPVKRIVNTDSGEERVELAYNRGKSSAWRHIVVPRDTISSAQKIVSLSLCGIGVTSENAREVVKYLSELEALNYDDIPIQNSTSHMGWTADGEFSPYSGDLVYDGGNAEFGRMFEQFKPTGDEDKWMKLALDVRKGKSVPARIALAASFAAPLVSKLNGLSFFCHFWGLQGSGKTVGLKVAASVWGKPELGGCIKNFGGTKNSQEINAAFFCNLPVFLDELQVISDRKSFDDIIYMLCEGFSKGRGTKEGGLQTQRRWSTCFLTTGEMPIVQSNSGGGAAVRTIEINYGGEPFFEDAREVASIVDENYGFAGPKFINHIRDEDTLLLLKDLQKQYQASIGNRIEAKQALSASIILAADKLADSAIFHDGHSLTPEEILPYLVTHEQADLNLRCYQWLIGYIAANPKRFEIDDNNGELWGVNGRDEATNKPIVYFIRTCFDRALQDGKFSSGAFLTWAKRKGLLKTRRSDNNTIQKTINGRRVLCVAIYLPDEKDEFEEVVDESMPF